MNPPRLLPAGLIGIAASCLGTTMWEMLGLVAVFLLFLPKELRHGSE